MIFIIFIAIGFVFLGIAFWQNRKVEKLVQFKGLDDVNEIFKTGDDVNIDKKVFVIGNIVKKGANSFFREEVKKVSVIIGVLFLLLILMSYVFHVLNTFVPISFLTGAFFSLLSGYIGLIIATKTAPVVTWAAQKSLPESMKIALTGASVMGIIVPAFVLIDVAAWAGLMNMMADSAGGSAKSFVLFSIPALESVEDRWHFITTTLLSFGLGASSIALLARVGGGIYTKAADMAADLVGKNEIGIDEDDPRNPATIADNVGDNVGDVCGMGADLYESFAGSILSAMVLAVGASTIYTGEFNLNIVLFPLMLAMIGITMSIIAVLLPIRFKENGANSDLDEGTLVRVISKVLNTKSYFAFVSTIILSFVLSKLLFGSQDSFLWIKIAIPVLLGNIAGGWIGIRTEYYTSYDNTPTKEISEASRVGVASMFIKGSAIGSKSVVAPIVTIIVTMFISYNLLGMYGIAIAAVGMLSTLALQLSIDVFGPIADNAGGNAEMAGCNPVVRKRTDSIDAVGNTTAAIGKGFAIGSTALTALALFQSYFIEAIYNLNHFVFYTEHFKSVTEMVHDPELALDILSLNLILGGLAGVAVIGLFVYMTFTAVSKAADGMIMEVRRQFEDGKILKAEKNPDYERCISIATKESLSKLNGPIALITLTPIIVMSLFGIAGIAGLLFSLLLLGIYKAIKLNNAGGAFDNAKKFIELGNFGGKGSDAHKAAVICDTIGDPYKDTTGPSINILIKAMTMSSIITFLLGYRIHEWLKGIFSFIS